MHSSVLFLAEDEVGSDEYLISGFGVLCRYHLVGAEEFFLCKIVCRLLNDLHSVEHRVIVFKRGRSKLRIKRRNEPIQVSADSLAIIEFERHLAEPVACFFRDHNAAGLVDWDFDSLIDEWLVWVDGAVTLGVKLFFSVGEVESDVPEEATFLQLVLYSLKERLMNTVLDCVVF